VKLKLNQLLADHTNQPIEKISEDTERDFYMSSAEAKDYGLIDEVIIRDGIDLPLSRKSIDVTELF